MLHCVRVCYVDRFERTGDSLKMAARQVQVDRGVGKLGVAKQHLDGAQIGTSFEKVSCEAVSQRVRRHPFLDPSGLGGGVDGAVKLTS